ncbi:hypothetical protein [Vibrio tapetis]|uniref:Uncharacterized protein n=1 Tax=Vibrio tapetis subsp. tapetis TaxID=1671868 RepID=A0A2N8ZIP2_9VIBR|nr:hypothetical protein [Vibrio tapetis]SON51785.1 protein of unknown function [Vibrio tapetis subsp. tapetis]
MEAKPPVDSRTGGFFVLVGKEFFNWSFLHLNFSDYLVKTIKPINGVYPTTKHERHPHIPP